ncbi:MAG: ABC transporter substrate-binding protein [Caldilineaceae bacterium]
MKQHLRIIVGILAVAGLFAGCQPLQAPPATPTSSEPVTIKLRSYVVNNQTFGLGEKVLIEQFQKSHPGITVDRQQITTISSFPHLRGDAPAELVTEAPDSYMLKSVERNELVDLTELWQKTGLLEGLPKPMQTFGAVNGKQYYIPYAYTWLAIYYNKAVFAQYQLTPPSTWDEFLAICETLKQKGEIPLVIPGNNWFPDSGWIDYLSLRMYGAEFHRKLLNGEIAYSDERVHTVFEKWQGLLLNGYVHPQSARMSVLTSLGTLVREDEGLLERQKAVMMLADSAQVMEFPKKFQAELDFFVFPTIDPSIPRAEVANVFNYLLPSNAAHREEAIRFAESIVSLESQQAMVEAGFTVVPVHAGIDSSQLAPEVQKGKAILDQAKELTVFYFLHPEAMYNKATFATTSFLNNPNELDKYINRLEEARQLSLKNGDFVNQ